MGYTRPELCTNLSLFDDGMLVDDGNDLEQLIADLQDANGGDT